jgi:hypothetical protein
MRIQIKTGNPVKDHDIRALYLIQAALEISSPHMKVANLAFFADQLGYELIPKKSCL